MVSPRCHPSVYVGAQHLMMSVLCAWDMFQTLTSMQTSYCWQCKTATTCSLRPACLRQSALCLNSRLFQPTKNLVGVMLRCCTAQRAVQSFLPHLAVQNYIDVVGGPQARASANLCWVSWEVSFCSAVSGFFCRQAPEDERNYFLRLMMQGQQQGQ